MTEARIQIGDHVRFTNTTFDQFAGIEGTVTAVSDYGVVLKEHVTGRERKFKPDNLTVIKRHADSFDTVAKPKHYQFFPDIEAIEIIARSMTEAEFRGYCLGNRLKYRLRAGQKDDPKQELDKSDAYIALFERCKGLCYAE